MSYCKTDVFYCDFTVVIQGEQMNEVIAPMLCVALDFTDKEYILLFVMEATLLIFHAAYIFVFLA